MSSTSLFRAEHISTDDSGDIQTVHAYGHASERLEDVLRIQAHGFSSDPPVGSHGIGMRLRGESDLAVILGFEDPKTRQKKIGAGNSALYNADGSVWKMVGKSPSFSCGETCTLTAKQFVFDVGGGQTLTVGGGVFAFKGGKITHNDHDIGATHTHTKTQPGAGLSGVPQ